ncbi:hypothetical protein ACETU7_18200 [Rhodococcus sp. 3Y1]
MYSDVSALGVLAEGMSVRSNDCRRSRLRIGHRARCGYRDSWTRGVGGSGRRGRRLPALPHQILDALPIGERNTLLSSFEIRQLDDTTLIAAEHVPVGFSGDARELAGPTLHAIRSQLRGR